jgi:hypothetical protein
MGSNDVSCRFTSGIWSKLGATVSLDPSTSGIRLTQVNSHQD